MTFVTLIILFPSLVFAYVNTSINKDNGLITANGSFFYPKIVWNCSDLEGISEVAAHGFNVALDIWAGSTGDVSRTITFLDNCQKSGIFGIPGIGRNVVRDISKLTSYIDGIKQHKALFAISFPDEATITYESEPAPNTKTELLAAYYKIKELAPNLIIICDNFTEANGVSWKDLGDVVDAIGIDLYPFVTDPSWNSFHSWQITTKKVETDSLAGNTCKAIWQFAQGSSSGNYQRIPTYHDMCLQFWASITYFAKGSYQIYGWNISSNGMKTNTAVRDDAYKLIMNIINPNIEWLANSLKYKEKITISATVNNDLLIGDNPYVSYICLIYKEQVFLVIINGHYSKNCGSIVVGIDGLSDQIGTVIADSSGNFSPNINNNIISIGDIEPFGYRVLRLNQDVKKINTPSNLKILNGNGM